MIHYKSFVNSPIDSITYIIYNQKKKTGIIIDPGTDEDDRIISFLKEKSIDINHILITHEHFDHILGIKYLKKQKPDIKVCSSEITSNKITNPKNNLSIFYNQTELIVQKSDIILQEGIYNFDGIEVEVVETPGHTISSLSYVIGCYFLSGDFLLPNQRLITNLPTGSKKDYMKSLKKIRGKYEDKIFLPGHGNPFKYNESLFEML